VQLPPHRRPVLRRKRRPQRLRPRHALRPAMACISDAPPPPLIPGCNPYFIWRPATAGISDACLL
jgi:hypothetical protein